MGKLMPVLFLSGMSIMAVLSWQSVTDFNKEKEDEYNKHISLAEEYESKEIYIDAVREYNEALEMKSSYDTAMHIYKLYEKLNKQSESSDALMQAMAIDPSQKEPYQILYNQYLESGSEDQLYDIIKQAEEHDAATDEMQAKLKELLNQYDTRSFAFDEFKTWQYEPGSNVGYAVVVKDGKYGIINSDFVESYPCNYDYIGLPANGVIPVTVNGDTYYMDFECYKKLVTKEKPEYLGSFSENYAPAKINGKYGYLDIQMNEYKFEYDYAGEFRYGIAAVEKNGRWAIINSAFTELTGYDFEEIVMDPYGFCSDKGVFFAKKDGKYHMYDTACTEISEGYDDVKLFASDEPAAVMTGGKWGFLAKDGTIAIQPEYDDADSFNRGYAPVKKGSKWVIINSENNTVVETECSTISAFSENEYAFANMDKKDIFVKIKKYE